MTRMTFLHLDNPHGYFLEHTGILLPLIADAFGRPMTQSLHEDAVAHFREAAQGQLVLYDDKPAGFALYSPLTSDTVWLQGLAIAGAYQGKGFGSAVLEPVMHGFQKIAATTRNPATVAVIGKATTIACPDLRLADPLQHLMDAHIRAAFEALGRYLGVDSTRIPFVYGRYPQDLYGSDPGVHMPFEPLKDDPRNAVMVAGVRLP